jgi:DNA-binding transcriptional regulator LsrR (DeoR family)
MSHLDEMRLMSKVARMYYEQDLRQKEITERLNIHQSTVSRLLRKAREAGIVRISVDAPQGIFADVEDSLERKFALKEAIVIETRKDEEHLVRDLGAAATFFLQTTVTPGAIIGVSSWSRALFALVDCMSSSDCARGGKVVQILGGFGIAGMQLQATHLVQRLAERIGATSVLLQAPALVGSAEAQRILMRDRSVREAADLFHRVTLALVGIGGMEPSRILVSSGNTFSPEELEELRKAGAVGDICFRFFDKRGQLVRSPLNNRVVGIDLSTLQKIDRVVGIAGGVGKKAAIFAALRSHRINILITDLDTAKGLLEAAID